MDWAQINLTTHVSWLPTIYLTQKGKRKERRPLSTVWYPWESTKQFVKSLHWTLIRKCGVNQRLKQCELGGYWAMQIWRGVGQTMATSEGMFSHRKFSLSRALKDGTREVQSRTRVKEPDGVSLDHVLPGTLLKHQILIKFLLDCWMGYHHGTEERWGLLVS